LEPYPRLFRAVEVDPYAEPTNPPQDFMGSAAVCGIRWAGTRDDRTGMKQYRMADFVSEKEAKDAGYVVTHLGHCGACSSLQVLIRN